MRRAPAAPKDSRPARPSSGAIPAVFGSSCGSAPVVATGTGAASTTSTATCGGGATGAGGGAGAAVPVVVFVVVTTVSTRSLIADAEILMPGRSPNASVSLPSTTNF